MSEEKIILEDSKNSSEKYFQSRLNLKKEQKIVQSFIFSNIIQIINQKEKFILGPEKTKIARFVSQNYIDVYAFLNSLLKNNNMEGLD